MLWFIRYAAIILAGNDCQYCFQQFLYGTILQLVALQIDFLQGPQ